jgi:hypothetical protein
MNRSADAADKAFDLLLPCPRCGGPVRFTGAVTKVRDGELRILFDQAEFDRMYLEHSFDACREQCEASLWN